MKIDLSITIAGLNFCTLRDFHIKMLNLNNLEYESVPECVDKYSNCAEICKSDKSDCPVSCGGCLGKFWNHGRLFVSYK